MITFSISDTIEALNGGQFVSPGFGTHAVRIIESHELIYVTQGRLDMFESDRVFHVARNQTLLLYPGLLHGGLTPYAAEVNFYWAHFRPHSFWSPQETLAVPKLATVRDPEALTDLFRRFISDQESGTLDSCSGGCLISLMLCMIGESAKQESPHARSKGSQREHARLVEAVRRCIDEGYRGPISTSIVAHALGYNPDYIERVFRNSEGVSISDAIHQRRISAARASLHNEARRNINEIGFECGYSDAGYFRRIFKRLTGLTPREFRSLYPRTHINTH